MAKSVLKNVSATFIRVRLHIRTLSFIFRILHTGQTHNHFYALTYACCSHVNWWRTYYNFAWVFE